MKTRKLKKEAIDNEDRDAGVAWDAFNTPAAHTPTPWEVTPTLGKLAITRPHTTAGIAFDSICHMDSSDDIDPEANAAFIVKAVNSHEELLKALKKARDYSALDDCGPEMLCELDQAIAKAEK